MNADLTIVVGKGLFRFPNLAQACAARDWAALNAVSFDAFRARYPDIPWTDRETVVRGSTRVAPSAQRPSN